MDYFSRNIESQTFELSVVDTMSSFSNIPFIFHYENAASHDRGSFMTAYTMRESFYRTLLEFPILAGHLQMSSNGRASVVVDRYNINYPQFCESECDTHFDQLKEAHFNWSLFPKDLVTVGVITAPGAAGTIKLANFHCVRLRDNSGMLVFANMSHYVVDGVGFCAFMDRWAEQCRLLCCADTGSIARQREFSFDRDIISKMLSPERRPLSKAASRMFFVPSLAADFLAWISPEWRGRILSFFAAMGNVEAHVFHVSKESLEDVRRSLSCFVPSDIRLSDNDLIASLASMTIV
ncbi:hypothetical protein EV174_005646, partial [Coemansia sp. RSA 2320]